MSLRDIYNPNVITVLESTPVLEAASRMRENHVGDLVVVARKAGRTVPVGIVTDRDLAVGVLAKKAPAEHLTAGDIMSLQLVTISESEGVFDAVRKMKRSGVRRLPVVNAKGGLVGILTADDLLDLLGQELAALAALVRGQRKREKKIRK